MRRIIKLEFSNYTLYEGEEPVSLKIVYPNYLEMNLPSWILDDIENAYVVGSSFNAVILPGNRRYSLNNRLNHLTGSEWIFFTNSVINTKYNTRGKDSYAHEIRKIHPTPKPPQLMKEIIEFFTKENELVFDYFMGVGGTLLGASLANRRAIGFELNPKFIEAYKEATKKLNLKIEESYCVDSIEAIEDELFMNQVLKNDEVSLILIDPPYSNMMSRKKTGGDLLVYGANATPFTNSELDLGNISFEEFKEKFKRAVLSSVKYLKYRGYLVVFIKDLQPEKKKTNLLHAEMIELINSIDNLHYKGLKIWADQTTKLYPYGYPFSFVSNQIHQYIIVFRKEK